MTKTQKNLEEIKALGGIVKASEWVTGSGKFTKPRAVPNGAKRYHRDWSGGYGKQFTYDTREHTAPWIDREDIKQFFLVRPRVKICVAVDLDENK